jgi:hypothetical protein
LFLQALATFLVWRLLLFACDFAGLSLTPSMGRCKPNWEVFDPAHYFWNGFFRWDAGWYQSIVREGYTYHADGRASSVVFYPLYPYLARHLGYAVGSPWVAGLIISNVSTLVGVFYLYRLGLLHWPFLLTHTAVLFLLAFPTSIFLSALYTEGLFFGLSAASMYYFSAGKYARAGVCGFLCALTRSFGVLLLVAYVAQLGWQLQRRQLRFRGSMLLLLLIPAGLGSFMLAQQLMFGDALAFIKAQRHWAHFEAPWHLLAVELSKVDWSFPRNTDNMQRVLDAAFGLGFLGLGVYMIAQRFPIALWVFVLCGLFVVLSTDSVADGTKRYCLSLWPAFLALAHVCDDRPRLRDAVLFASTFFLAVYSLRYMQCAWAG